MNDLDAVKARLAKATPGPWEWSVRPKRHILVHRFSARGFFTVLETQGDVEADYPCAKDADRDLIEHAPADLAALVAEVERLRAEVERARAEERAAIVAYLRGRAGYGPVADAIEQGEHLLSPASRGLVWLMADWIETGEHLGEDR